MKLDDFVIATQPINGIAPNSVGIVNSIDQGKAQVYFIGKNKVVVAPFDSVSVIDVEKAGDEYPKKICNVCHIFKPTKEFSRN